MSKIPGLPTAWKRALWWTVAGIGIAGVLVVGAWVLDQKVIHEGMVMRNVTLDGEAVGGLGPDDSSPAGGDRRRRRRRRPHRRPAGAGHHRHQRHRRGGRRCGRHPGGVDGAGRSGNLVEQFEAWAQSFLEPAAIELKYAYDQGTLDDWVGDLPDAHLSDPVEPTFSGASGSIEVRPGVDGAYRSETVAVAAADTFAASPHPSRWRSTRPDPSPGHAGGGGGGGRRGRTLADSKLTVSVGEHVTRIGPKTIRRWIVSRQDGSILVPVFDEPKVQRQLERILAEFADEGEDPTFSIVDGEVDVGRDPPTRCCSPGIADLVFEAVSSGRVRTLALPLVEVEDAKTQAARLGISEMISEFTTFHNCCESRVENIHRIADIVRGVVIHPGETFSVNGFVGERTTEKGFVPAGTIQFGRFEDAVGGGISQFATTMFNAAFFAGLQFEEYQSHSLYIDRYPYGREATLSYPHPDLVVTNDTPFGVLLWPTYTGSSITMQMWSTRYWDVEQTGQNSFPRASAPGWRRSGAGPTPTTSPRTTRCSPSTARARASTATATRPRRSTRARRPPSSRPGDGAALGLRGGLPAYGAFVRRRIARRREPRRRPAGGGAPLARGGIRRPGAPTQCVEPGDRQRVGSSLGRTVLLKAIDEGFVFFTNYGSRKGDELEVNPWAAGSLTWLTLHRQLRAAGRVERTGLAESDEYFATRPRGAQLAAAASTQSHVLSSRQELVDRVGELTDRYPEEVPRPQQWGGYRLIPIRMEFWQGRIDRMHDRVEFVRHGDGWLSRLLWP